MANEKRILVLGAGFVVGPVLDHLLKRAGNSITLGSLFLHEAEALANKRAKISCCAVDLKDAAAVEKLVQEHDLVISLIPAPFHPIVAKHAIKHKKNMVTASYVSPDMQALDDDAKNANIVILNEIGLDPGIDHLSALQTIHEVERKKGKVVSFKSWCGGLPAPEASNNPLGYKFSWSVPGALNASRNDAVYTDHSKRIEVAGTDLLKNPVPVPIFRGMATEGIPNRDSLKYIDVYGLHDVHTMFRGTLRFPGFCEMVQAFVDIGLFDKNPRDDLKEGAAPLAWKDLVSSIFNSAKGDALLSEIRGKIKHGDQTRVMEGLEWLGLLNDTKVAQVGCIFEALCAQLADKLKYEENERDMVLMQHIFEIEWADGKKEERKSTLCAYGDVGGYTAMSRTVGFPCAIAAQLVLDGGVTSKGVMRPTTDEIIEPVLAALKELNIYLTEESRAI